jgi:uncharacterized protein
MPSPSLVPHPLIGMGLRHPHYAAVLEREPTNPIAVDFLEVHAENFFAMGGAVADVLDQAALRYPISLHGVGLSLGSASGIDPWHLEQLQRLVARTQPILVSDHACFGRAQLTAHAQAGTHHALAHANDLLPIRHTTGSLNVLCANVSQVQDALKRRIAVENISAYLAWQDADYSEVEFLNALTQRTGCGLLLDLNNIYVNALNRDIARRTSHLRHQTVALPAQGAKPSPVCADYNSAVTECIQWLDAVRADSVMEIHLAGFTPSDSLVIDDHASAVHDPVWQLYRHTMQELWRDAQSLGHALDGDHPKPNQRCAPPTLIEWDLELPELEVLLHETATARRIASESWL